MSSAKLFRRRKSKCLHSTAISDQSNVKSIFTDDETDAVLLVDADNAFNKINRKVMLHNIRIICPVIATYVINSYYINARLFVSGGVEIESSEGTTQGDPTAMPLYALASIPLLNAISTSNSKHSAYADDLSCAGKIKNLLIWWNILSTTGPKIGYFPKASKSWLIVKPEKYELAKSIFRETSINITIEGKRHLGAVIGSDEFKKSYVDEKVSSWVNELTMLSKIAQFYPQSAYCAYTSGFCHKFNYIMRTIPDIAEQLRPIEEIIRHKFIPAISDNRTCNEAERKLLSLPVKMGGLGLAEITIISEIEFLTSINKTKSITHKIVNQNCITNLTVGQDTEFTTKANYQDQLLKELKTKMNKKQLKANEIARSDGASAWLTTLPLKDENFMLTKREFIDAVHLRYGWDMKSTPDNCVCQAKFSVDHAMSCKVGGFISIRHNELVDLTADLLSTTCKDVVKEPVLQPTPDSTEDLRADISARGFWQKLQRTFLDVRVFYPFAPSYQNQNLASTMKSMEKIKKRKYNKRILEAENGSFTPLIFSSNGGMSHETKRFFSRLSELVSEKGKQEYAVTASWIKRKISFSLIRTAVICIRGSRSRRHIVPKADILEDIDVLNELVKIKS